MNPYTSLWAGVTPGDGPQEFHLVLLDNGRTAVLADEVGREALHCIRCSACLNVCPVYERTGGHAYGSVYPGPIGAVLSPQLTGVEDNASLPYASSLCGACYDVCPVAIDIPSILVHLRAEHVEAQTRTTPEAAAFRALSKAMSNPRLWRLAQRAAGLGRFLARGKPTLPTALPPPASKWTRTRDLPTPPAKTFTQQWAEEHGAMSARDEILGRIRTALGDRPPPCRRSPATTAPPTTGRPTPSCSTSWSTGSRTTRPPCSAARRPRSRRTVAQPWTALGDRCAGDVVVAPGVPADWRPDGAVEDDGRPAVGLADFAATVTGVAVAIAETGTLVLDGSPLSGPPARCRCCPTAWSAWSRRPRSSAACPRASPASTRSRR